MKQIILTTLILFSQMVFAEVTTIFCSHLEVCKLINLINLETHTQNVKTENLVQISGDPHEYEPAADEIKKLIKAPTLINGPIELNPWISKVKSQRISTSGLKSVTLEFSQKDKTLYQNASLEALSHFWLYPRLFCSFKEQLERKMQEIGYPIIKHQTCDFNTVENELKKSLKQVKFSIILTHDALMPLLNNLAPKGLNIIAIKGSGHHEEVSSNAVKKMYDALKGPTVIWIIETGINVPSNIKSKIRNKDIVISIDTSSNTKQGSFPLLYELKSKLDSGMNRK